MAGVGWLVLWGHQALTHGPTERNEMQMALGFTWMDSGKLYVLPFLLLIVTMVGLHRSQRSPGRLGKSGLVVVAALVWLAVGTAIEFWGVRERILPAWLVPVLVFGAAATVFLTPAFVVPGIVWLLLGATLLRRRWSAARP